MPGPPIFSKNHMKKPCSFAISAHAMVQYLDRGTKFNVIAARHHLHQKRWKAEKIKGPISDKDLLTHLEEGQGYLGHRGNLEHRLKKSWLVHRDEKGCFRLMDSKLIAVMNPEDNTVITILTQEMAQKKLPFDIDIAYEVYMDALMPQLSNAQLDDSMPTEPSGEIEMSEFTTVTKEQFDNYPGQKRCEGEGTNLLFQVRNDETRPLSEKHRDFTDRLLELFEETGLAAQLAAGGLQAQLALTTIASATVTATDESLPQYARRAVTSLAQEVGKQARDAAFWNVGAVATSRNDTLVQRRLSEDANVLSM